MADSFKLFLRILFDLPLEVYPLQRHPLPQKESDQAENLFRRVFPTAPIAADQNVI